MKRSKVFTRKSLDVTYQKINLLGKNYEPKTILNIKLFISILVLFAFIIFLRDKLFYGLILSILTYYVFDYFFFHVRIKRRILKLDTECIYFFKVLNMALNSGKGLKKALTEVSNNLNFEISREFKKTLNEVTKGKNMVDALKDMSKRLPSENVKTMLLELIEAYSNGNNIVEVMNTVIDYVSDDIFMEKEILIKRVPIKIFFLIVFILIPLLLIVIYAPDIANYLF